MSNVKSYFEAQVQSDHHAYLHSAEFYRHAVKQIKRIIPANCDTKFLDIGCGNGSFIKALIEADIRVRYFALDVTLEMIKKAKKNLAGFNIEFFVADGFKIPIRSDVKFDVIHIDSVLHHLIEGTRAKSIRLIEKMLRLLMDKLEDKGILIVQEVYYNSYIFSRLTSFVVFYGLKLIRLLNLDTHGFMPEIKPGLEVNFLHEKQLEKILSKHGSTYLLDKKRWGIRKLYKLFLLRERGHITFSLQHYR
jgi:SAM-dependent methyltransferase